MKKLFSLVAFLILSSSFLFAANTAQLQVNAKVSDILSVAASDSSTTFEIIDAEGDLIPSKQIGSFTIVSNQAWAVSLSSLHNTSVTQGRLKLSGAETYIPYTFTLKDGDTLVLNNFSTASSSYAATGTLGKTLNLVFNFTDDATVWPIGTYQDTIVLTVTRP
jgi:spore coat protein U-like protein